MPITRSINFSRIRLPIPAKAKVTKIATICPTKRVVSPRDSISPIGTPPLTSQQTRVAKTPVKTAPSVPPTPWTPKASRASSYLSVCLSFEHAA